jgi:predicted small metal-binding protein
MELYVSCDCGWSCVAGRDELIALVGEHAVSVHGIDLTEEQVLAAARPHVPGATTGPDETATG